MNNITQIVLSYILIIFSNPTSLNRVLGFINDSPQGGLFPGKLIIHPPFTNKPNSTHRKAASVLRVGGRAPQPTRGSPGKRYVQKSAHLPDVSVNCWSIGFNLRVKRSFYGFWAASEELTLGETCKSNGLLEPNADLLFTYALTDCQSQKQALSDHVLYKYVLHYVPLPHRPLQYRVNVGVQCRYNRTVAIPTLLRKVLRSRSGDFEIQLMDDSWSTPIRDPVFLLGQKVNVQVSIRLLYPGVKLFIQHCDVAIHDPSSQPSKYSIIDNYGCLRESRVYPGAAEYRGFRLDNVVQFSFSSFQFTHAPHAQVSLQCELSTSGSGPSSMLKFCSYNHPEERWVSMYGPDSLCDCCESVCNQTKTKRNSFDVSTDMNSSLLSQKNASIWFEAKLAEKNLKSFSHKDFGASITHISSEEQHDGRKHKVQNNTAGLVVEDDEEMHGEVEILKAVESFMGLKEPDLNLMKRPVNMFLSESRDKQMLNRRLSVALKDAPKVEEHQEGRGFMRIPGTVMETSVIDELTVSQLPKEIVTVLNSEGNRNQDEKMTAGTNLQLFSAFDEASGISESYGQLEQDIEKLSLNDDYFS